MADVAGILLAAGAGRRMGRPKALMRSADAAPWLTAAVRALQDGGCSPVVVVLGAAAEEARALLGGLEVQVLEATDWATGMGASLRTGLASLTDWAGSTGRDGPGVEERPIGATAALIHLVDLPDVGPDVVARVVDHAAPDVLARADYGQGAAHPVLIGREHWPGVIASAHGDRGARDYLRGREVLAVDCSGLATGRDVDTPADL
ncbi:nucleotidyltransferase family protein [Pseudactinotalea sp. Z1748]|uniref:nucleotidyltransferase family protein n=1 Tax=Pseudactinotalea sp. Z1748 TaxID=3413027 RepID=UPI003C7B42E4